MLLAIVGICTGIVLFLCAFLGFREGLRLGIKVAKGEMPKEILNPIKIIKDIKESKKDAIEAQYVDNWLTYDGTPQKEVEVNK